MSAANMQRRMAARPIVRQSGVAAAEFGILAVLFFTMVLAVIELARVMFVLNTLYEVTRHAADAAAFANHRDTNALDRIRQRAVFRDSPGNLIISAPVSDESVRISYQALLRASDGSMTMQEIPTGSLPICPRDNREICLADPNASNCIRFVSASICDEADPVECTHVVYRPFLPLIDFPIRLPKATTIRAVESFGSMPEGTPCL